MVEFQDVDDVLLNQRRCGRCECYRLRVADPRAKVPQPRVVGAKVVAPLADAVGLIDGQQLNVDAIDRSHERVAAQTFGCDVDQFVLSRNHLGDAGLLLVRAKRAIDVGRRNVSCE